MSKQTEPGEYDPAPKPGVKLPRKVIVTRALFVVLLWWLISLMIPVIPSPAGALVALLKGSRQVVDGIYYTARGGSLKESADKVAREAVEQPVTPDSEMAMLKRKHPEAVRRAEREDSLLRTELKSLSTVPFVRGKTINIVVTGSDARLGTSTIHADAIHLFTVNPDSGIVEITSIPRDTYCDLGYPDTTSFNHITNARALGMPGFMKRVEEIVNRGAIKYYVEVGFSQVMGILELLGYKDPAQTLKFLRARKTLRGGDIQRSHNQAVFMRQSIISKFDLLTGTSGEVLLTAGLQFVNTNLTKDFCQGLIYKLKEAGFPGQRHDAIRLRMPSMYKMRLAEMMPDSVTVTQTLATADRILEGELGGERVNVAQMLRKKVRKAIADSTHPRSVVNSLERLYQQKAWLQIGNRSERHGLRDSLLYCLSHAYQRMGNMEKMKEVIDSRSAEDLLYEKTSQ